MSIFNRIRIKRATDTIGTCEACGNPIFTETDILEGERYVELSENRLCHVDCMPIWIRMNEKEAKRSSIF